MNCKSLKGMSICLTQTVVKLMQGVIVFNASTDFFWWLLCTFIRTQKKDLQLPPSNGNNEDCNPGSNSRLILPTLTLLPSFVWVLLSSFWSCSFCAVGCFVVYSMQCPPALSNLPSTCLNPLAATSSDTAGRTMCNVLRSHIKKEES